VNTERARLKQASEPVPGYTAWVIAAASRALVDHPYANSQVTAGGVAYLPQVNLGVAVSLDDGLIVPVIEQADTCSAYDLHTSVADLAGRAREGKLKLNELEGGTFSVTALGMYGVDMFTPVINPPNSAILGVGRLRTETRWEDGVASPMTVMTLSLTWDHRAFDGAPAAEFAQSIVRYLENPAQLNA
jgi:pyruvate dehydrogenase E2 component (dihydrolipoamide acetyltransferase)